MRTSSEVCGILHNSLENRDLDSMLELFADDAELRIVDKAHPPSHPLELHGKSEIGQYLGDVLGRDMKHRVSEEIVGDGHFAYTEECEYPDGTRVLANATVEIRDGKIAREIEVQAWDE